MVGVLLGFALVFGWFKFRPAVELVIPVATQPPVPTSIPQPVTRMVVILLNESGLGAAGIWQWWSHSDADPQHRACIVSNQAAAGSSGRTVEEIMALALETADYPWVASNTQVLAPLCGATRTPAVDQVLFVSPPGLVALVDGLGGVTVEGERWDGARVWNSLAAGGRSQLDQQRLWTALAQQAVNSSTTVCEFIPRAEALFAAYPLHENPCSRLVWLLQRTPAEIGLP